MKPFRSTGRLARLDLSLPPLSRWKVRARPFFRVLHELLEKEGEVTLGHLAEVAAEQTAGLLVFLLALPSLVPGLNVGAAPLGGMAVMTLGTQMARGNARPWLPSRMRAQPLSKGRVKDALARLEGLLDRFRLRRARRRALNLRWTGVLIFWIGLLLALPVPLPFGNILPAGVLCLVGAALLEEQPAWGWLGAAGALGVTVYFFLSFDLISKAVLSGVHAAARLLGA